MLLHKYQSINKYTLINLASRQNWISNPKEFNDPFEFMRNPIHKWDDDGNFQYLSENELRIKSLIEEKLEEMGVICYTTDELSTLMWSVYADNHRGFCMTFDLEYSDLERIHKVNYVNSMAQISYEDFEDKIDDVILNRATTKYTDWSYEQEWRELFHLKNTHTSYISKSVEITFGCVTPYDELKAIWDIAVRQYGDSIQFSKVTIQEGNYRLGKESVPKNLNHKEPPSHWGYKITKKHP